MIHETVARLTDATQSDEIGNRGYFYISRTEAITDFSPDSKIKIEKGDVCLVLHINQEYSNGSLHPKTEVFNELEDIANGEVLDWIDDHEVHVIGFTNARIATLAQKIGFTTLEIDIPDEARDDVYALSKPSYNGPIFMCHQSGKEFFKRFGDPDLIL